MHGPRGVHGLSPPTPSGARLATALAEAESELRRAIGEGGEVVGYFTPLAPPTEVIEAAGALPYRLLGTGGADADLRGMGILGRDTCSFCRSVLGAASSAAPPVTALASGSACDRLRRAADAWPGATGIPLFSVALPRVAGGPNRVEHVAGELRLLAREISARTGVEATDSRLTAAIRRGNRCRAILAGADRARRKNPPRLSGTELFDLVRARHALTSERFLDLATGLADEIDAREPPDGRPVRLLLVGPTLPDERREVLDIAEETGRAVVVSDLTDSGTLGYGEQVDEEIDPFFALAKQILAHPILAAPLRPAVALRSVYVREIEASRPDGILFRGVAFCRPWNSESVPFREIAIRPFLDLRVDGSGGLGQTRTRVEAFIETLAARRDRGVDA